jgi:hypothetical protein
MMALHKKDQILRILTMILLVSQPNTSMIINMTMDTAMITITSMIKKKTKKLSKRTSTSEQQLSMSLEICFNQLVSL